MSELFAALDLDSAALDSLPRDEVLLAYLTRTAQPRPADVLRRAAADGRPLVQPRCGVGDHRHMAGLLRELEQAGPGFLSVTIDSYTRLRKFESAARLMRERPAELNGYPLVAHGWARGRELAETVSVPLEIRHGSPDARELFAIGIASGICSFEGGALGYTLPYSKTVSIAEAWDSWRRIDQVCGGLARHGVVIDRELFGTLTAVLVPPSISMALTLLEAMSAETEGVACISVSYPQGGQAHQDIAALRAIRALAQRYLDGRATVHPVLHEFMGVFPRSPTRAEAMILYGGLVARLGGAVKVVNKTKQEAHGIPNASANADGIRTTTIGSSALFDFVEIDMDRVEEEQYWLEQEVSELLEPFLTGEPLGDAVARAFAAGRLDIPFSPNVHARGLVVPRRDRFGAIRYADAGSLPFSTATLRRNRRSLGPDHAGPATGMELVTSDIYHFARTLQTDQDGAR